MGMRCKLRIADPVRFHSLTIGFAIQESVPVGYFARIERKAMQHGQSVEPVPVLIIPDAEGPRSVADQIAAQNALEKVGMAGFGNRRIGAL